MAFEHLQREEAFEVREKQLVVLFSMFKTDVSVQKLWSEHLKQMNLNLTQERLVIRPL